MKSSKKIIIAIVGLILTPATALGHAGHEEIGNLWHIEYLMVVGLAVAIAFAIWSNEKPD